VSQNALNGEQISRIPASASGSHAGLLISIQNHPKILIAAVNGAAIGWGCTQLFNFDLVYASTRAFFQTPFMALGFVPEGGSSYTFPKVMGKQHANRLLVASDRLTAQEMYVSGLVTQVIDENGFLDKVCEIAKRIGGYSGESLRVVKELTNREEELKERRRFGQLEGEALKVALNSPEAKQMMADFASKSKKGSGSSKL
jgi:enoyl-CoA hydratase/carnithine racemase